MAWDRAAREELPPLDVDTAAGASWAKGDPRVLERHAGEWVVAVNRRAVAFGPDLEAVVRSASAELGKDRRAIVVCAVAPREEMTPDA